MAKIGDEANIVFTEASCSAEVVARQTERCAVLYKGMLLLVVWKNGYK